MRVLLAKLDKFAWRTTNAPEYGNCFALFIVPAQARPTIKYFSKFKHTSPIMCYTFPMQVTSRARHELFSQKLQKPLDKARAAHIILSAVGCRLSAVGCRLSAVGVGSYYALNALSPENTIPAHSFSDLARNAPPHSCGLCFAENPSSRSVPCSASS